MANPQKVPSPHEMRRYVARGLTQQEIADAWCADTGIEVTRGAIGMALGRYGMRTVWRQGQNPRRPAGVESSTLK